MAILIGLAVGILVGMWQGYWVAYVGIPAFIVTLAGMLLFRGLQLIILNAESIVVPDAFQKIANGYLPEIGGRECPTTSSRSCSRCSPSASWLGWRWRVEET